MTATPYVGHPPASAPAPGASHRLLLWPPVLAAAVTGHCLIQGDLALAAGVGDLDPLYGLGQLFIGAACVVFGLVSLVLALVFTFLPPSSRAGGNLAASLWAAGTGVALTVMISVGELGDANLDGSLTAGDQYPWQAAAVVASLVPLALVLLVRTLARRDS